MILIGQFVSVHNLIKNQLYISGLALNLDDI